MRNTTDRRRLFFSRWLLGLFVVTLITTSLHRHPEMMAEGDACEMCMEHVPHSGHFADGASTLHDCLLCQLMAVTFMAGAALAIALPTQRKTQLIFSDLQYVCSDNKCLIRGRAPPMSAVNGNIYKSLKSRHL